MILFKLKVRLAERDMTQRELAQLTGIRPSTISQICSGTVKHLPIDVLEKICQELKCQPNDLMEWIDEDLIT